MGARLESAPTLKVGRAAHSLSPRAEQLEKKRLLPQSRKLAARGGLDSTTLLLPSGCLNNMASQDGRSWRLTHQPLVQPPDEIMVTTRIGACARFCCCDGEPLFSGASVIRRVLDQELLKCLHSTAQRCLELHNSSLGDLLRDALMKGPPQVDLGDSLPSQITCGP